MNEVYSDSKSRRVLTSLFHSNLDAFVCWFKNHPIYGGCSLYRNSANLMVRWKRLICCRKVSNDSCPCSQMTNMSSMYHHQTFGLVLVEAISIYCRFAMNRFAYMVPSNSLRRPPRNKSPSWTPQSSWRMTHCTRTCTPNQLTRIST